MAEQQRLVLKKPALDIYTLYGTLEADVLHGECEADLQKHVNCVKNPGHQQFIPVGQFGMEHLPSDCRHPGLLECVQAMAKITCRLSVSRTSPSRPPTFPGTQLPYPGGQTCSTSVVGTGWLRLVKHPHDDRWDEKSCYCQECRNSNNPQQDFAILLIETVAHVVFDEEEAKHTTCHFFFDKGGTPRSCPDVVTFHGMSVYAKHTDDDMVTLQGFTHSIELGRMFHELVSESETSYKLFTDSPQPASTLELERNSNSFLNSFNLISQDLIIKLRKINIDNPQALFEEVNLLLGGTTGDGQVEMHTRELAENKTDLDSNSHELFMEVSHELKQLSKLLESVAEGISEDLRESVDSLIKEVSCKMSSWNSKLVAMNAEIEDMSENDLTTWVSQVKGMKSADHRQRMVAVLRCVLLLLLDILVQDMAAVAATVRQELALVGCALIHHSRAAVDREQLEKDINHLSLCLIEMRKLFVDVIKEDIEWNQREKKIHGGNEPDSLISNLTKNFVIQRTSDFAAMLDNAYLHYFNQVNVLKYIKKIRVHLLADFLIFLPHLTSSVLDVLIKWRESSTHPSTGHQSNCGSPHHEEQLSSSGSPDVPCSQQTLEEHPLVVMVSHPHGCSKQVSLGYCYRPCLVVSESTRRRMWSYTTTTCPGTSGARVLVFQPLTSNVQWYSHSGCCGHTNYSSVFYM